MARWPREKGKEYFCAHVNILYVFTVICRIKVEVLPETFLRVRNFDYNALNGTYRINSAALFQPLETRERCACIKRDMFLIFSCFIYISAKSVTYNCVTF